MSIDTTRKRSSLFKQAGRLGGFTLISSALGFVREILIAHDFGASHLTDSYLVALAVPSLIYGLFFGSGLNVSVIPRLSALLNRDRDEGNKVFAQFLSGAASLSLLVTLVIFVAPQIFVLVVAPGLTRSPLTADFARTLAPLLFLLVLSFSFGSFHCAQHKAAHWGLVAVIQNIAIVAGLILTASRWGIPGLLWSTLAGGFAALVVQARFALKDGFREKWSNPLRPGQGQTILANMIPFALVLGVGGDNGTSFVEVYLIRFFGSALPPGSISLLALGNKLMALPVLFVGAALGLALLPHLSVAVAENDNQEIDSTLTKAISYALLLICPIVVVYLDLATPIVHMVFARTALTSKQLTELGGIMTAYAGTIIGFVLVYILNSYLAALKHTRALISAGATTIMIDATLMYVLRGIYGARGIAIAITCGSLFYAALLLILLRRNLGPGFRRNVLRRAAIVAIGGLMMHFAIRAFLMLKLPLAISWLGSAVLPAALGCILYLLWISLHRERLVLA